MRGSVMARTGSGVMYGVCLALAVVTLGGMVGIAGYLAIAGAAVLPAAMGAMTGALGGTARLTGLAAAVAVPVGIAAGFCVAEFGDGRPVAVRALRWVCEILCGVPGVTVGVAVYWMASGAGGMRGWAGELALAVVMAPAVAGITARVLWRAGQDQREPAAALGAGRATTLLRVLLPRAGWAVVAGAALVVVCAAGEAAPLLFTAGQPTLAVEAYGVAGGASPEALALADVVVLCGAVIVVNFAAQFALRRAGDEA